MTAVLGSLAVGATVFAIALIHGSSGGKKLAGWIFVLSAILAYYVATAMLLAASAGRIVLPLGKADARANRPGERVALLELRLVGVRLPATAAELRAWARGHDASAGELAALERLEERLYASANEVGEALFPVEAAPLAEPAQPGRTQSGDPPGGPEYRAKADK